MIGPAIHARLQATPGVTALVGARGYPDKMPQDNRLACYYYQTISNVSDELINNSSGAAKSLLQITAADRTRLGATAIREQIRLSLQGWLGTITGVEVCSIGHNGTFDQFHPDALGADEGWYVSHITFSIVYAEEVPVH